MEITTYTINDIGKQLDNPCFWNCEIMPLTKHRALSHIHNPRARIDDVVLFVCHDNDRITGYFGVLPDTIFIQDHEHRVAWGSTIWVDPGKRGSGIGRSLLLTAFDHYDVCSSGFTSKGKQVADSTDRFTILRKSKGMAFISRSCTGFVFPKKFQGLRRYRSVLGCIDRTVNLYGSLRQFNWKKTNSANKPANIEFISELDDQTDQFIREKARNELSRRTAQELNWIIRYPWVLSAPFADMTGPRYFFSSLSRRFSYINVNVLDSCNEVIGFVMFKVKDSIMSIPFVYFNDSALKPILYLIGYMMAEMNIDIFITYNETIIAEFAKMNFPCLYKKPLDLLYYISNTYEGTDFSKYFLQDGEGDAVFT